jgi:hypothetical protein
VALGLLEGAQVGSWREVALGQDWVDSHGISRLDWGMATDRGDSW